MLIYTFVCLDYLSGSQILFGASAKALCKSLWRSSTHLPCRLKQLLTKKVEGGTSSSTASPPSPSQSVLSTPDLNPAYRSSPSLEPGAFMSLCSPVSALQLSKAEGSEHTPYKAHACALFEDTADGGCCSCRQMND